ncbi:hypothetical protein FSP39_012699 [Pinctada imbricata]|uniref:Ubiquitin carboxyl-terminal hydrolase MINDY n=1 Tax=Pinctada imbricata TaxID=66713 RepID=A0AA89CBT6_PINIB|nr:hypothetical protein FSP39_012699 [Pinctada imbricata]
MDQSYVEDVASSLVREYLSRKGLKLTLQTMDEEKPRSQGAISNRQLLVKELHIENLMKKNKVVIKDECASAPIRNFLVGECQISELSTPLRAMLEVITKYFLERTSEAGSPRGNNKPSSSRRQNSSDSLDLGPAADKPMSSSYSRSRTSEESKNRQSSSRGSRQQTGDLIIEDNLESETLLGGGRSGLIDQEELPDTGYVPTVKPQSRPRSAVKQKGLSGPISSSLDDPGRRKFHKPRPLTAGNKGQLAQKLTLNDNDTTSSNVVTDTRTDTRSSSAISSLRDKRLGNNTADLKNIDSLIGKERKSSIQDVLEVESENKQNKQRSSFPRRQTSTEASHYSVDQSSIAKQSSSRKNSSSSLSSLSSKTSTKVGDVEFGDYDDLDNDIADLDLGPRSTIGKPIQNLVDARPIALQTAINLKTLIFGSPHGSFNDEWLLQSFSFCDLPRLKYGIVQKKGGPCGVLAAVQACILQELIFGDCKLPSPKYFEPSGSERSNALATALAKIFWRCGESGSAVVAIPSGKSQFQGGGSKYRYDDLTETLMLNHFKSYNDLHSFLTQNIRQFQTDGCSGVVLALYSAIFSRYIDNVRKDMDEPTGKLMGAHGYCTQDMVNLLLTGAAVSNVFNDVIELDSGDEQDSTILQGVKGRSAIGLLSLFEHYKSCQVGTYYKTPKYPIWVVCSESHFSVLFSTRRELISDWKAERRFDLYHYDGLARQQEEIKLTIETFDKSFQPPSEDDLVPPLEHCIRTKWNDAKVDWNGSEPIL